GQISSSIQAGGSVEMAASGAITGTIGSGGSISLSSDTPIDVQISGGSVTVDAPGGTVSGTFDSITTGDDGSFIVNEQPVVGSGKVNPRQIIVDQFIRPIGGTIGAKGEIIMPSGFALGLIAPQADRAGPRKPVLVNTVSGLG